MEINTRKIMPLVSARFAPGSAREYIETIEDHEEKQLALADYYQYSGEPQKAVAIAKKYLDHEDMAVKLPAHTICFISGLAIGDAALARKAFRSLEQIESAFDHHGSGKYCTNILRIILYLNGDEVNPPVYIPEELPNGVRYFATFFLALYEYLNERFEKVIGMAKNALILGAEKYPIPKIYLHLISAAALIRLKDLKEAEHQCDLAWEIARADGFFAPFAQLYVLLAGLNGKCIRKTDPEGYREISSYANTYISTWMDVHDGLIDWCPNNGLTKTEQIVAMLFGTGFSAKEIAGLMGLSVNTIKTHIARAYGKTAAKDRGELTRSVLLR